MKPTQLAVRNKKINFFTMKDAVDITGFTRWQLFRLNELGLVQYYKSPILYTWKQLIFLKVLFFLRRQYTFDQLAKAHWQSGISQLMNNIDQTPGLVFVYSHKLKVELIPSLSEAENINFLDALAILIKNSSKSEIVFGGISVYNITVIVAELEKVGIERVRKFRCKLNFFIRFPTREIH